ncbi:MAG TPA: inositol monophosphatase family protein [Burkholderiaceae bacterium]|nr:inositol monophosphatase family protein [Burkholderiaceae bacterium]
MRDTSGMPADEHGEAALPPADSHPRAAFIAHLGDLARPIARRYFRVPLGVERKADESPVTRADRDIETALRTEIRNSFPADGLFGEEHGTDNLQAPRVWVVDPIDGTKSFISGMPIFGTLVAVVENGVPVVGMIDMPALNERWIGASGHATTFGSVACATRKGVPLAAATLYATSPDLFGGEDRRRFEAVSTRVAMRRFGGDCYAYALLASGFVDAVIETGLAPYDYLAMVPIIEGAGGRISDWSGQALGLQSAGDVVAAGSPELHAELVSLLRA